MSIPNRSKKSLNVAVVVALLLAFGNSAHANLIVSPSSLNFGKRAVGAASASIPVTLTNNNTSKMVVSNVSMSAGEFSFSAPSLPVTLTRGQSLTVTVIFSPAAAQRYSGNLVFTRSNGPKISVPLRGTGVEGQALAQSPTITTQPLSETVIASQSALFSVAVTGTTPLNYQWSKNGVAIIGATSSTYTTPATTSSDNTAQFTVLVRNASGSATSNAAILTVNPATLVLKASSTALNFGSETVSITSSQNVTLTSAGNSSVTISGVSVSGGGFNANGISTGLILSPGQTAILSATFTPSATGSATGRVTVSSNASNSPEKITLSGNGLASANHAVSIAWTPVTSTVTGYNTYSSTVPGGPYSKLTLTPVPTAAYTDTSVKAGLTYYYVATSVDSSNNESPYSSEISAIVP